MTTLSIRYYRCLQCGNATRDCIIELKSINFNAGCMRCGNNNPITSRIHGVVIDAQWPKLPNNLRKELQ